MNNLVDFLSKLVAGDSNDHRVVKLLLILLFVMIVLVAVGIGILWNMSHQAARLAMVSDAFS